MINRRKEKAEKKFLKLCHLQRIAQTFVISRQSMKLVSSTQETSVKDQCPKEFWENGHKNE